MANDIFDWDDEEGEERSEAEVWGAFPLAQPPDTAAAELPEAPAKSIDSPIPPRPSGSDWPEIETVMRPRPEPWRQRAAQAQDRR